MPKLLLPPERPKLYSSVHIKLTIANLWLCSTVGILLAFISGVLTNWGLVAGLASSLGVAIGLVREVSTWQQRQFNKKLAEYEQAYFLYAKQRIKKCSAKTCFLGSTMTEKEGPT